MISEVDGKENRTERERAREFFSDIHPMVN